MFPSPKNSIQYGVTDRNLSLPTLFEGSDLDRNLDNEWSAEKNFWSKVPSKIERMQTGEFPEITDKMGRLKLGKQDFTKETNCTKLYGKEVQVIRNGQISPRSSPSALPKRKDTESSNCEVRELKELKNSQKLNLMNKEPLLLRRNNEKMYNVEEWVKSQALNGAGRYKEVGSPRSLPKICDIYSQTSEDLDGSLLDLDSVDARSTEEVEMVGDSGRMPVIRKSKKIVDDERSGSENSDRSGIETPRLSPRLQSPNNFMKKRRHTTFSRSDSPFPSPPMELNAHRRGVMRLQGERGAKLTTPIRDSDAIRESSAFSWPCSNSFAITSKSNDVWRSSDRSIPTKKNLVRCYSTPTSL